MNEKNNAILFKICLIMFSSIITVCIISVAKGLVVQEAIIFLAMVITSVVVSFVLEGSSKKEYLK